MNIIAQDVIDLHLFFSIIIGFDLRTTANHIERMKRKTVTFVARSLCMCMCVGISLCIHNSQLCICARILASTIKRKSMCSIVRIHKLLYVHTSVIQNIRRNAHTHRKKHLVPVITVTITRHDTRYICVLLMWKRVVFCVRYEWHQAHNRIRWTGQTRTEWFEYLQIYVKHSESEHLFK